MQGIFAGRSMATLLNDIQPDMRPAVQSVSYHAVRNLGFAIAVERLLISRPIRNANVRSLLLVAITLLDSALEAEVSGSTKRANNNAPIYTVYTLVDQAVRAAKGKLKPFKALINATLRNYIRQHHNLKNAALKSQEARYNYPMWWIKIIKQNYPEHWSSILSAGREHPPLVIRVNQRATSVNAVLEAFAADNINAVHLKEQAIWLPEPLPVHVLPGFSEGWWSVQDYSAQLSATLLPLKSGMKVLDACSAPGGKTSHMLEQADISLLALDNVTERLDRVRANLNRLNLLSDKVSLVCADAATPENWWDGTQFDAVLADVPCTSSGVVRRNPDIPWLRRESDINDTAHAQYRILNALWPLVAPGGYLLFASCSIFPQEGELQAKSFAQKNKNAHRLNAPGLILPLKQSGMPIAGDGFFYALFKKGGTNGA